MKLQQTKDYLLLIDEEARGQKGINWNTALNKLEILHHDYPEHSSEWNYLKLVVAYYPLTKEAKELDLPLLPNPFEVDDFQQSYKVVYDYVSDGIRNYAAYVELLKLKKIAQSKQFSLEDMIAFGKKCFYKGFDKSENDDANCYTAWREEHSGLVQSLSTQRLPSEFIPEMESELDAYYRNGVGGACKLKTITNSTGKIELVGTWKY